ncbi:filamentous haemagglutinin family protein [Methylobacter sp. S3L5C]|uniref:filamentous haemagglutinin family protein n=1 Tax=Methylobacter sp. S3L5C TaxID=2839024 RepID=UPI001FAE30AD|nr:filamentous haemagglutinin family protein [Methylobacter sp. S3L5C]UOA10536.1 filamentous hemagglutinin family protein [Methylobacter sp. S3L5C]
MSHKTPLILLKPVENLFRLKPLVAYMRVVIAGGLFAGVVVPTHAELPVPVVAGGFVSSGSATNTIIGNTLRIDQQSDKAILNWQSFNVGKENTVQFVQPGSSSIALNRINQADPSQIFGQIIANGQVYLYNQNGFVFGKDSVVNTNSLLASTLNITDEAFNQGITRVFDDNNGEAALAIEPMKSGATMDPKTARILIEAGAKIHTDKSGRIIIVAPTIDNKGSLSSDNQGQIILAASQDKVYLQAASTDSPFAGLVVEVDTGGTVTNAGDILAKQGNITMAGFAVNQQGRLSATTSVNVNGSIRLLAQEGHGKLGDQLISTSTTRGAALDDGLGTKATVTFAPGSVTQVIADANGGTAIDEQLQPESYLEVSANTVNLQSGSAIKVTGGKVDITATDNLADPTLGHSGRIYVESGALIDVSGTKGVVAPMARNVGQVSVQSYELRDAPLQRTGVLKGETINVDLRKPTSIVDISGALARITRGIDERLGIGGQINLTASGDVIINDGANIDISGGSVIYQDGYINTTKLMNDFGGIVDISDADPNEHYQAIFGVVTENHQKWGVTTVYNILDQFGPGLFQKGYVEGKDAGAINIKAPLMTWNGNLSAGTSISEVQRSIANMPVGGTFAVDLSVFQSLQNVLFQTDKNNLQIALNDKFPKQTNNKPIDLVLTEALFKGTGVANVSVKSWGNSTLSAGASIEMTPGGTISLEASSINIDGTIKAAGGTINLTAATNDLINLVTATNDVLLKPGLVTIAEKAVLDVSGAWVNDFQQGLNATPTDLLTIDGGKITIKAGGDLLADVGSVMRADGGGWLNSVGKLAPGDGGAINLAAVGSSGTPSMLRINSDLSAYGLTKSGELSLSSDKIIVGTANSATDDVKHALVLGVSNNNFNLLPDMGFSAVNLDANTGDLKVKGDAALDLKTKNLELKDGFRGMKTGSSIRDFTDIVLLPENLRSPLSLTLAGTTGVSVESGSSIVADKGSTIGLQVTSGSIFVDGVIKTAGGNINLNIDTAPQLEYDATQAIWLGKNAWLSVTGDTRLNPVDVLGRRTGTVMDGGKITLDGTRGYVILEHGSLIDVSGTQRVLDIQQADASGFSNNYMATPIASNAGTVSIKAAEGIVLDGTIQGFGGSATTHGARLDVAMDRSSRSPLAGATNFPDGSFDFTIVQTGQSTLDKSVKFGDVIPVALNGQAIISADKIAQGGISDFRLISSIKNTTPVKVSFLGDVNLTTNERISIDAQRLEWANDKTSGTVNLNTAYLTIGSSLSREVLDLPTTGAGKLTANTQWTELFGATRWDAFSDITLKSTHDLRAVGVRNGEQRDFLGALVTAANLNLQASQIYPSTLSSFTFAIKNNPTGDISITGINTDASPLSAGGALNFTAPFINQKGVIKAPLGTINLTATKQLTLGEGSLTSVSAANLLIPFGVAAGGLDWLYPLDSSRNLLKNTPPEKQVILNAPDINLTKGSVIDISGGGDLQAYEFQPGAGGSYDYLQPGSASYQGGFAIMPSLGTQIAPFDQYESVGTAAFAPGSTIYLNGSSQLAAGQYTILPAHYALLPGAFLITPQANSQDRSFASYTKDGLPIVSGYQMLAGTSVQDSRTSAYKIETSAQVKIQSQYDIQTANNFAEQYALRNETSVPLLPMDSGQISIVAQTKLLLDGTIKSAAPGGRGARMDIAADNIEVVTSLDSINTQGTLQILDSALNNLKVDSLLLGGARKRNVDGSTDVSVTANMVSFDSGTQLMVTDLIAAAKQKVEVKTGATLEAKGSVNAGDSIVNIINVTGTTPDTYNDGAFLRLSADKQIILNRASITGNNGELVIESGATLKASKSMLLDASQSSRLEGDILMNGGSLNLGANAINLGDVAGFTGNALNLSNQKLLNLSVDELILNSRGTIGFHGNVGQVDAPIKFDRLVINAAGFSGFGSSGQAVSLEANDLVLANPFSVIATTTGNGLGGLDLLATNFTQGAGTFAVNGFNTVNVNAKNGFITNGNSGLTVASDLNLNAGYLTATSGSSFKLDASGHNLNVNGNGSAISAVSPGYGGAMEFIADTIAFDANALLPSGKLNLHALVGNMAVGSAANIDLAGRAVIFADTIDYTPGGTFTAIADNGAVTLASGSKLDVSTGGGSATGGNLVLKAPKQTVTLAGQIKASGGSAEFDVSTFSGSSNFDSLMGVLNNAGIDSSIYFHSRDADIVQTATNIINANNVTLVADKGAVDLFGQTHVNGVDQGGKISVYAGGKITLENGSQLTATGAKGGKVLLSSVDGDGTGTRDGIELKDGSLIDVSGATVGGDVTLRALRVGNDINIQPIAGTVKGAARFYAEGVKKYSNADLNSDGQINANDIANIQNDTAVYMTNMDNVATRLGHGISLTPGVEIDYTGALALSDKWDLVDWRYNSNAGNLVIRASEGLTMSQSLTDGFKDQSIFYDKDWFGSMRTFEIPIADKLQSGNSWSYTLVSGADLSTADNQVAPYKNDLVIGSGATVRTGSGDMKLIAGRDITFTDGSSTVYNGGKPTDKDPYGSLTSNFLDSFLYAEFPVAGGDLSLVAGGNINGTSGTQGSSYFNDWLLRTGNTLLENGPTVWGVALGYRPEVYSQSPFQQNIGSFGGGNVLIQAKGNISNLDVMMPTTGKQTGTICTVNCSSEASFITNQVEINGGGNMQVKAGGDIAGGTYYLGKGAGLISADGSVTGGSQFTKGPQLLTGDTQFSVYAGKDVNLTGVSDSMILGNSDVNFFSYTDASALTVKSLTGSVNLNSDATVISNLYGFSSDTQSLAQIYPGSLYVSAFSGNIDLKQNIVLFPSATGQLNLLAEQNITSMLGIALGMSDGNKSLLPDAYTLMASGSAATLMVNRIYPFAVYPENLNHATIPIHTGDQEPVRVITRSGDIENINFNLAKKSLIKAGRDIKNLTLAIQNISPSDVSLLEAGRDITYTSGRNPTTGGLLANDAKVEFSGPGEVLVKSGRNIDLGASGGLSTVGNVYNSNLANKGANLTVIAGANSQVNYAGFINTYLKDSAKYKVAFDKASTLITGFMRERLNQPILSDVDALKAFTVLTEDQYVAIQPQLSALVLPVMFNEVNLSGSAAAAATSDSAKKAFYESGTAAINALFPDSNWKGDLSLFFSKIQTVDGGDINLLVPGGQINAGLAVSFTGAKPSSELGIVVQREGNINAVVNNDFLVNTSRVFALDGGDIQIWSSTGNIDAGKGAKSAIAAPPPKISFDTNGNLVIEFPAIVSGSGIRTAASSSGAIPGNVSLFAPIGVVNAGEAGIGGTNVTISATAVLGANNIQVGGVSTGVPAASTGSLAAGLTGTSNMTASVSQVAQAVTGMDDGGAETNKNAALGMFSVEVLGFGD